ncbi:hypothetical protein G7Y89_g11535 [Cudoniella acicularis]|uniref:BTB domain-containing protein n=1 Tax=Cudoniella acicularis TaxID=354080 RepID=A0A8H4W018_9HELO|nr:hypothetical protein G7Y89_g11535 [Cudoniella acicularis]
MVPQPIADNSQVQSLTVALKNICRDYPAGSTVLRELLQNADDAGATIVRFFLDDTSYPTDQLLDPELAKYQGPALLAYNNASFTDKDFNNLRRLGDSKKIEDGLTTGKFGRGFNSVYNWTDSPSIVSRERLLILDPHQEWSTGGPVAVVNHLDRSFAGTVIRIPLRTAYQAERSQISDRHTTFPEVLQVLENSASELKDGGLLFMRNIEKLEFISTSGFSISIEIATGAGDLHMHKTKILNAVKTSLSTAQNSFDHSFEAHVKYTCREHSTQTSFVLHHSIGASRVESGLSSWAERQKLVPWVAIAAQLPAEIADNSNGLLFTVLPLPISSSQPVHIHGLFSLAPDRARLHHHRDASTQDPFPAKWNELLLGNLVPLAWTRLLTKVAQLYPNQSAFEIWPRVINGTQNSLNAAMDNFLKILNQKALPLWPTDTGYVAMKDGFLATGQESGPLRDALRHAKVPVVYVPQALQYKTSQLYPNRVLSPNHLYSFLKRSNRIKLCDQQTKHQILEYLVSQRGFLDYGGLEIFPFEDGAYRSIQGTSAYVHRNDSEKDLFKLDKTHTLDLDKLSSTSRGYLIAGCDSPRLVHPSIRYRSAVDFGTYFKNITFQNVLQNEDMTVLNPDAAAFVPKAWDWICDRGINISNDNISSLWLLPLTNGTFRKIKPLSPSSKVLYASEGELGGLTRKLSARCPSTSPALLRLGPGGLGPRSISNLTKDRQTMARLFIDDAENVVHFTSWLNQVHQVVNEAIDEEKHLLAKLIAMRISSLSLDAESAKIADSLRPLSIFRKVSWSGGHETKPVWTWTSLNAYPKPVGVGYLAPIPDISGHQFLDTTRTSHAGEILQKLRLVTYREIGSIIQDFVIPAWADGQEWTNSCKEQVSALILMQSSCLNGSARAKLRTLPIIPVGMINGKKTSNFAAPSFLINPLSQDLLKLHFSDEEVLPDAKFFENHGAAIKGCDLKGTLDEDLLLLRVRVYASGKYPAGEVEKRCKQLFKLPCPLRPKAENHQDSELCLLKWLPVRDTNGDLVLKSPNECRGQSDRLLVGSHVPTLGMSISRLWESRLGWDVRINNKTLLAQLRFGVDQKDRKIVDAVLGYIFHNRQAEELAEELLGISCVRIHDGSYSIPSKAFRPTMDRSINCGGLRPYLGNVDTSFWDNHKQLFSKIGVREKPGPLDLIEVQKQLEAKLPLDESDVSVAIEVANIASHFSRDSVRDLKVLTDLGSFCSISEINFDDIGLAYSKEGISLVHPGIPRTSINRLLIEPLSERILKEGLNIEDIDEEDFDQKEKVTTRIADTLDRYRVEATFKEYLANADDTRGATGVSWLLDDRTHQCRTLLTPELKNFQGPSLLVHNDGVFSEEDFNGFKNVGEGSKAKNKGTIGQFGRGSQTMYHWTDVPMILSGKFLLILDPQQQVLPMNRLKGKRRPGMKIPLSKLKISCPDQLAPFHGLWDYKQGLDTYPGTIFRFPLRSPKSNSCLRSTQRDLNTEEARELLSHYFDEARISLLFLRRIISIDFKVHGDESFGWSVCKPSSDEDEEGSFSKRVVCSYDKNEGSGPVLSGKDKWWVAVEDLEVATKDLPYIPRREMKSVECGMAALISSTPSTPNLVLPTPKPRIFNVLPLPLPMLSDLPVHFHATFLLTGDRQSLALGNHGTQSQESAWNNYLLSNALPKLYLSFLEDLGREIRQGVLDFWPEQNISAGEYSKLLCSSFWMNVPKSSCRLFPKTRLPSKSTRRQPAELYDIQNSIFDFLPEEQSEMLAPLLMALNVKLVRHIPSKIAKDLQQVPNLKIISGPLLRGLFKSEDGRSCLIEEMSQNKSMLVLLLKLIIPIEGDPADLDGCHIVPLADGTLGTLKLMASECSDTTFHIASNEELELFNFASKIIISPDFANAFGIVLQSGRFNIAQLQCCHIGNLLAMRPSVSNPNEDVDRWLTAFWKYWNKTKSSTVKLSELRTEGTAIFRAKYNDTEMYADPKHLEVFSAVIEPKNKGHQKLCSKIPGLYRFDHRFMPKSYQMDEESLHKSNSFYRFIKSIRDLATRNGMTLGEFIEIHLGQEDMKILSALLILHVPDENLAMYHHQFSDALKSIRLWPTCSLNSSNQLVSAEDAFIAERRFLVPWMKDYSRFIDPKFAEGPRNMNCLMVLGVKKLPPKTLLKDYILPMPSSLSKENLKFYEALIEAVSQIYKPDLVDFLRHSIIAVDGVSNLDRSSNFFDHQDQIFIAAFRHEGMTRFLHGDVHRFRRFWLNVGLRHRKNGFVEAGDYLQCLHVLSQRLGPKNSRNDRELKKDVDKVLSVLTDPNQSVQKLHSRWEEISKQSVFPPKSFFGVEPTYRRDFMISLSAKHPILNLSQLISQDHVAVCWSQTPFSDHQPTREVFNCVAGNGRPKIDMVWRHLQHLKNLSQSLKHRQVPDFLSDLHHTYEYLQEHLGDSTVSFNLQSSDVWLNLNTLEPGYVLVDEIVSSWQRIDTLVLSSSCDAGPVKAVRESLMRYEKLLRGLGCNSIIYPTVERPKLHIGHSVSKSLQKLRKEGKLLDITYMTEDRQIQAHRIVLAAVSEKCAHQFNPRWAQEDVITYNEDNDPENFLSYHTLSTMINYAYEDEVDWSEIEVSESDSTEIKELKLDMLLDLLKGADSWLIPALKSQVEDKILIAGKIFVNLKNVVAVLARVEEANALNVAKMCKEFIERNRAAVENAHSS